MPLSEDSWLSKATLSPSRSRFSTNCPDCICRTSECGMGSAAGDKISPGRADGTRSGRKRLGAPLYEMASLGQGLMMVVLQQLLSLCSHGGSPRC